MFAVFVGLLSTGFSFYKMDCKKSCPTGIYFHNPHESGQVCNVKQENDEPSDDEMDQSCCSSTDDSPKNEEEDKHCCDIEEILLKKDFDFASNSLEISFLKDFDFSVPIFDANETLIDVSYFKFISYRGPPEKQLPSGKQIRINLQSLLFDFSA